MLRYDFLARKGFYAFLWATLAIHLFLSALPLNLTTFFFSLSTMLIFTHVLYGGFFLFQADNRINRVVAFIIAAIYISLVSFARSLQNPAAWLLGLIVVFLGAIALHAYYRTRTKLIYLQEFCNYKIYVEISGIFFSLLGILFNYLFPGLLLFLSVSSLFSVLRMNNSIFKRKKLYTIFYHLPEMPSQPFVSVVVVAYNEEHYIGKLLESLTLQDYPNFEVVLVDDKSTDKTIEVAKGFTQRLPLTILQKDIRGVARSRNHGASYAKGEIILFLDADVILPRPDFISRNIKAFTKQQLSIAGVDFIPITEDAFDKVVVDFYRRWLKWVQCFNPRGIGICLFVYSQLHRSTFFDETIVMSEDFDYVKRASQHGKFRIITDVPIEASWRRFHNENRFLLMLKYLVFEWHRQHIGEIRRKILPYEFGNPTK